MTVNTTDHPTVNGKPRAWLRIEGLSLLVSAIALFATTHQPWWLIPLVILLPDLFMVGYLGGTRTGAAIYNLGHAYPLPAALSLFAVADHRPLALALGLVWFAHIGMDRALGYGLKYDSDFKHTHLADLAAKQQKATV